MSEKFTIGKAFVISDASKPKRKKAVKSTRLHLLKETRQGTSLYYQVLGSKLYNVRFPHNAQSNPGHWTAEDYNDSIWTCSCPDYMLRRHICKHVDFVKTKVLQGNDDWQTASIRLEKPKCETEGPILQLPYTNKNCGVCFEPMNTKEPVVWCEHGCGLTVHQECQLKMIENDVRQCIYCDIKLQLL